MRFLALALILQFCGCYSLHDCVNKSLIDVRDHCEAHTVWKNCGKDQAACDQYPHHFGEGFREGYRAVAAGGNGCPPTLPPRKYWCVLYQNDSGRQKAVSWYNGYAAGAAAGQGNGVQERNRLVTATDIYHNQCPACRAEAMIDAAGTGPTEPELNEKSDYFPEQPGSFPEQLDTVPQLPPIDSADQAAPRRGAGDSAHGPHTATGIDRDQITSPASPVSVPTQSPPLAPVPMSQAPEKPVTTSPEALSKAVAISQPVAPKLVFSPKPASAAVFPTSPVSIQITDQYQVVKISDQSQSGFVHIPRLEGHLPSMDMPASGDASPAWEFVDQPSETQRPSQLAMSSP
ncbi:MAG: hypothetical protein ACK5Q5_07165 [Planctomycetaceae bacterium]